LFFLEIHLQTSSVEMFEGTPEWIVSCQSYEGGFGGCPGMEAHGGYSFCGLAALTLPLYPICKEHLQQHMWVLNELPVLDLQQNHLLDTDIWKGKPRLVTQHHQKLDSLIIQDYGEPNNKAMDDLHQDIRMILISGEALSLLFILFSLQFSCDW
jgi:hypothetical protein